MVHRGEKYRPSSLTENLKSMRAGYCCAFAAQKERP